LPTTSVAASALSFSGPWVRACFYLSSVLFFFYFDHTATTDLFTLSLHDALPIFRENQIVDGVWLGARFNETSSRFNWIDGSAIEDRKSTRLNSSHVSISYAVFCLKKKRSPHLSSLPLEANPRAISTYCRLAPDQS